MSESLQDAFVSFARVNCGPLIRDLSEAVDAPLQLLDGRGKVILAGDDHPPADQSGGGTRWNPIWAPIEAAGEKLGGLAAYSANTRLQPLLISMASHIAQLFTAERDLDRMTDQVSQSYDEVNLLYRFSRAFTPEEGFTATARRILEETADLLEIRLLVLYRADAENLEWSLGANASLPGSHHGQDDSAGVLDLIRAEIEKGTCSQLQQDETRHPGVMQSPDGPIHYVFSPVRVRDEVTGCVGIFRTEDEPPLETGELRLLECLSEELGTAATTRKLYQELREMLFSTVRSLVAAIDAKDEYTRGHSERVYYYSIMIGERLGLSAEELQMLSWASLLHDVGKIAIQRSILNKPSRLTDEEFQLVQTHPARGCKVLDPIPQLRATLPAIRHHHERYDGKGYPDGLKGEEIPLLARIIAVADTYDAISSSRAYRDAQDRSFAIREIRDNAGKQFDPMAAQAFLELLESGAVDKVQFDDFQQDAA